MPYKIDLDVAKKILRICTSTVKTSHPAYAEKVKDNTEKMIDESLAVVGSAQWLEILKGYKDINKEIGKIILDHIELEFYPESWVDMETGDGRLELCDQNQLIDWIIESVIYTLEVKAK